MLPSRALAVEVSRAVEAESRPWPKPVLSTPHIGRTPLSGFSSRGLTEPHLPLIITRSGLARSLAPACRTHRSNPGFSILAEVVAPQGISLDSDTAALSYLLQMWIIDFVVSKHSATGSFRIRRARTSFRPSVHQQGYCIRYCDQTCTHHRAPRRIRCTWRNG